jgi:hypothetical protein
VCSSDLDPNLKEAVEHVVDRKIKAAFEKIDLNIVQASRKSHGTVTETINQFLELSEEQRKSTIILTPANEDRERVNKNISAALFKERTQNQLLCPDDKSNIYENKNLTEAAKTRAYNYKKEEVLLFSKDRNYLGIKRNDYLKVTKIDIEKNQITAKNDKGKEITFDPIKLKGKSEKIHYETFVNKERIFKEGDKVAFMRSIKNQLR